MVTPITMLSSDRTCLHIKVKGSQRLNLMRLLLSTQAGNLFIALPFTSCHFFFIISPTVGRLFLSFVRSYPSQTYSVSVSQPTQKESVSSYWTCLGNQPEVPHKDCSVCVCVCISVCVLFIPHSTTMSS